MKISIKTIAKLAGCSTATVSNVLNNKGMFSAKTRDKVLEIVRKNNFTINAAGRNLRTGKAETVGITFYRPNADIFIHEFYQTMMGALERTMADNNYEIILSEYTDTMLERKVLPPFLLKGKADGMIVLGGFPRETIKIFAEAPYPVVMLDSYAQNCDCVITDGMESVENAMAEISKLGHAHADFFGFITPDYNTDMRIKGFLSGIEKFGFDKQKCKIHKNFSNLDSAVEEFDKTMSQKNKPSVIVACNDRLAVSLMAAAKSRGLKIPDDIAFVGFDDIYTASMTTPSLSTIHTDTYAMGREAANILLNKINNPGAKKVVKKVSTVFVRRASL